MIISYDEFDKVDFRSGTVTKVEPFPRAKKPAYNGAICLISTTTQEPEPHESNIIRFMVHAAK